MDKTEHVATHLARNLAALRHVRTLTQGALAKSSGLPRSTIANLESGVGNPSLAVLPKGAGALGVPIEGLLPPATLRRTTRDGLGRKSTPLKSSHLVISDCVFSF